MPNTTTGKTDRSDLLIVFHNICHYISEVHIRKSTLLYNNFWIYSRNSNWNVGNLIWLYKVELRSTKGKTDCIWLLKNNTKDHMKLSHFNFINSSSHQSEVFHVWFAFLDEGTHSLLHSFGIVEREKQSSFQSYSFWHREVLVFFYCLLCCFQRCYWLACYLFCYVNHFVMTVSCREDFAYYSHLICSFCWNKLWCENVAMSIYFTSYPC